MSIFNQAAKTVIDSIRKCPQCGHEQMVAEIRKSDAVKCKSCGKDIPPKN